MLEITIPAQEIWDPQANRFRECTKDVKLRLEHSLLSLAKWESKWNVPFVGNTELTPEQTIDYIRCMCVDKVDPSILDFLTTDNLKSIMEYIDLPMTATWFSGLESNKNTVRNEVITAEIIYYWMVASNIPFSCEKWHLNRLITLVKVCSIKNAPKEEMSQKEILNQYKSENARRKAMLKTRG